MSTSGMPPCRPPRSAMTTAGCVDLSALARISDEGHAGPDLSAGSTPVRRWAASRSHTSRPHGDSTRPIAEPLPRRFGTIAADVDPTRHPGPADRVAAGAEIRRRFLEFFAERGHTVVPSASLVPAGDQTLLFTNSGMVQFKDVLTGAETRSYTRAVDYQRVPAGRRQAQRLRGGRPDAAPSHALRDARQLELRRLLQARGDPLGVGLPDPGPRHPGERLAATTYTTDDLAFEVWRDEIGLPPERLVRWGDFANGDEKNWWRMADIGPCGPCSEIHFDRGAHLTEGPECVPDHSEHCPRWLEIWNLVFMEFELHPDRSLTPLPAPGVDTGMGLERLASVLQQVPTNYDTDLFTPIHARMRELLGHDPDAVRAGAVQLPGHRRPLARRHVPHRRRRPSQQRGRGYVLRRILRRAVRHGRLLGRREPFMAGRRAVVIDVMGEAYPHLVERRDRDPRHDRPRGGQFARTLDAGTVQLEEALDPADAPSAVIGRPTEEDLPADAPVLRRRGRVPAARHVRLPDRPDRRARGRVRRPGRPRRVRGRARRAARAQPLRARRPSSPGTRS